MASIGTIETLEYLDGKLYKTRTWRKNLKDVFVTLVLPSASCHPIDSVTQVGSPPKISS